MFILGTNDENGSLFIAGVEREQWDFFSQFFPAWEELPARAKHFETWMQADEYRSDLEKKGIETRLYIWEWHPT